MEISNMSASGYPHTAVADAACHQANNKDYIRDLSKPDAWLMPAG